MLIKIRNVILKFGLEGRVIMVIPAIAVPPAMAGEQYMKGVGLPVLAIYKFKHCILNE